MYTAPIGLWVICRHQPVTLGPGTLAAGIGIHILVSLEAPAARNAVIDLAVQLGHNKNRDVAAGAQFMPV